MAQMASNGSCAVAGSVRYCYAYLHGFASGPNAYKGKAIQKHFQEKWGIHVHLPDLNRPSFEKLTMTAGLTAIDELHQKEVHLAEQTSAEKREKVVWRLIGSSMGGLMASRWTEQNMDKVDRLVLLCPAFALPRQFRGSFGPAFDAWRANGWMNYRDGNGNPARVHFGIIDDLDKHPHFPSIGNTPCLIVHATNDQVVSIGTSREYREQHKENVELVEVEDDHGLVKSTELIIQKTEEMFGLRSPSK